LLENRREESDSMADDKSNRTEDSVINSGEQKNDSSVSLDNRMTELEKKVKTANETAEDGAAEKTVQKNYAAQKPASKMKSPYDSPPTTGYNPNNRMPLPKMNSNPVMKGSSADVYNDYYGGNSGYPNGTDGYYRYRNNPNFGANTVAEQRFPPYMESSPYAAAAQPAKENVSTGLKSYLIIVISITIIFILGFAYECVRTYNTDGIFGGANGLFGKDFDKYLDTDYDFGFKFNEKDDEKGSDKDNSGSSKNEKDSDTDAFDFIDNGSDEDDDSKSLKAAPDKESVVDKNSAQIIAADQPENIDSAEYTTMNAFKKVENAVVNVVVFDGEIGETQNAVGTGSGIIVTEDGYIVTNSHVINDSNNYSVEIVTTEGNMYAAAIVGYDTRTDLAVLKIDGENLTAVEFVNSDQIKVGQDAIAVGNPGGMNYSNSVTRGCVSALNRTVSSNRLVPYIQTDAAINPGNSGGPLLNSAGQVMGINTIKIANSDYEGMGFAISSNTVVKIANDLIGNGYVSNRVRLGIVGTETTKNSVAGMPEGILINDFSDDSTFKKTAAKKGDIITAINGKNVKSFAELFSELDNYSPGDSVKITLYRSSIIGSESNYFDVTVELLADNGETQR